MDLTRLHAISNNYRDVRLISIRDWKSAAEIFPRDPGGPYMVVQEGYDPGDFRMNYDEFVLGKSGEWTTVGIFLKLPKDVRRAEFIFGTAAEVIDLLGRLGTKADVVNTVEEAKAEAGNGDDDLKEAFVAAKERAEP